MEASEPGISNRLFECISTLKSITGQDVPQQQICLKMSEQYGINPEETKAELTKLISSGRLVFMETSSGNITYNTISLKQRKSRPEAAPPLNDAMKEISHLISKCVKHINQINGNLGASYDEIQQWMAANGGPEDLTTSSLQNYLDQEVLYVKLKLNEAGLYVLAKKRGRPFGTGCLSKKNSKLNLMNGAKGNGEDTDKKGSHMGRRKRIRRSQGEFEFFDPPTENGGGGTTAAVPAISSEPLCDFCLKTAANNKSGVFEELLFCRDCTAKAHASCMGYSKVLTTRARLSPWQCIDCKTCCLCLDAGNPDNLLFCDACDKGYHMSCHDPPLQTKPQNKWACSPCLADGVNPEDLVTMNADAASPGVSVDNSYSEPSSSRHLQSLVSGPMDLSGSVSTPSPSASHTRVSSPGSSVRSLLPSAVTQWSVSQVAQYIEENGFSEEAKRFNEQEIDGRSLLLLLREDVLKNLSLKLGPALKIYEKIRVLQKTPATAKLQGRI